MSDSKGLVSILVPAFNAEGFIGRTLDSLVAQTYRHLEIIVVDDGSTDGTSALIEARSKADARIRLFRTDRKGPPCARNYAAAQARGEYLAPCDSDDLWRSRKLERQLAAFDKASPK